MGRRIQWFWTAALVPLMIPLPVLGVMWVLESAEMLREIAEDEGIIALLLACIVAGLILFGLLVPIVCLTLLIVWQILQEVLPRKLRIDNRTQTGVVWNLPGIRTTFQVESVEYIDIMWLTGNGRVWCYVCLQIQGRRTWLRLIEVISKSGVDEGSVFTAIQPLVQSVAVALNNPEIRRSEISPWRCFWIWGN